MIELALVLSFLCVFGLVTFDIIRALQTYSVALSLSKSIANTAYRQCVINADEFNQSTMRTQSAGEYPTTMYDEMFDPTQCLTKVSTDSFSASVPLLSPDTDYVISMYRWSSGAAVRDAMVSHGASASRYNIASFAASSPTDATGKNGKALQDYQVLVVAEVFIPYSPMFQTILNCLNFDQGKIYAATLF